MEEATMTKGTKFVKTSNFHTLYGPVSCSKKQGAGGGGSPGEKFVPKMLQLLWSTSRTGHHPRRS